MNFETSGNGLGITIGNALSNGPPPAGRFTFQIADARATVSSAGNEIVRIELTVVSPRHTGRRVTVSYLTRRPEYMAEMLTMLDLDALDPDSELQPEHLIGQRFVADLEYNDDPNGHSWPRLSGFAAT